MSEANNKQDLINSAKSILDRSLDNLDGQTLARLREARRGALKSTSKSLPRLVWAGGFATVGVVLVLAALWVLQPTPPSLLATLEDVEILASSEDLDFYDDLDFYHWLANADLAS